MFFFLVVWVIFSKIMSKTTGHIFIKCGQGRTLSFWLVLNHGRIDNSSLMEMSLANICSHSRCSSSSVIILHKHHKIHHNSSHQSRRLIQIHKVSAHHLVKMWLILLEVSIDTGGINKPLGGKTQRQINATHAHWGLHDNNIINTTSTHAIAANECRWVANTLTLKGGVVSAPERSTS